MKIPSLMEMLGVGVHFGHKTSRWHPKMKPFLFGSRSGVHIIDLEKTQEALQTILPQVKNLAKEGKTILFVTTKPQAREVVKAAAIACGQPYLVDRWIGGLLTNWSEMKRMINEYINIKDLQATGGLEKYTKKEQLEISKELVKKDLSLVGLTTLKKLPDALFLPALQCEKTAVMEAAKMKIPLLAIADSNSNPEVAEWAIPGNDDAVGSITMIVNLVAEAINEGRAEAAKEAVKKAESETVKIDEGQKTKV